MYIKVLNLIIHNFQIIFCNDGVNNMKSNAKSKIIILIALGIIFALSPIITTNLSFITGNSIKSLEYSDDINFDNKNPKISAVSGKIHIDNNWTAAKSAGICTGNGTYSEPYVIEDLVIDGGGSGSCILIENSAVYFRIENCTLYNSRDYAGIELYNVDNSQLIDNNCSSNYYGIHIYNGENNTVSGNTANNNRHSGIYLAVSDNNNITGNTANNNRHKGIYLVGNHNIVSENTVNNNNYGISFLGYYDIISGNTVNNNNYGISLWGVHNNGNNIISGNIMNNCGLLIYGSYVELDSHEIDNTNQVNGKPLYYYTNEVNLGPDDFLDAGQVILFNCIDSLISNLNTSYCTTGIMLFYCNNNNISGNIANNNYRYGIILSSSDYNNVSGNTANNNQYGIYLHYSNYNTVSKNILHKNCRCIWEENCIGNTFQDNEYCNYGEVDGNISGYHLFFLLSTLSVAVILISKKLKKS